VKILVISHMFPNPSDPTSGIFVLEQLRALRKLGVEATVLVPTPWVPSLLRFLRRAQKYRGIPYRDNVDGFTVEYPRVLFLPASHLFLLYGFFHYLRFRPILRDYLKHGKYELIHAHTTMPDGLAAVLLGREFAMPVICTVYGSDINLYPLWSRFTQWATSWVLRKSTGVIAVSADLRNSVIRLAGDRDVAIAHNGADSDQFAPSSKREARAKLGIATQIKVVLFVGYLCAAKSIVDLLRAFAALSRPDTLLYLVGDGDLKVSLMELANSLSLQETCIFVGHRPHSDIPTWLAAADCLVLCSTSEGLPTILAEAMTCGVPVVATAVGGVPEIVKHGVTGYLVRANDPAGLAKAIDTVLDSDCTEIVKQAEALARTKLTWDGNARTTLGIYHDALSVTSAANPLLTKSSEGV
jgi:teichuronic acid biosynthesis glycosyltransferase TuaC